MKKVIKAIFEWIFADEIKELRNTLKISLKTNSDNAKYQARFEELFGNMSVSVDVNPNFYRHSKSWAVISLQGRQFDYIKFCDLGDRELRDIAEFLRQFERNNKTIDACPEVSKILKFESNRERYFY